MNHFVISSDIAAIQGKLQIFYPLNGAQERLAEHQFCTFKASIVKFFGAQYCSVPLFYGSTCAIVLLGVTGKTVLEYSLAPLVHSSQLLTKSTLLIKILRI